MNIYYILLGIVVLIIFANWDNIKELFVSSEEKAKIREEEEKRDRDYFEHMALGETLLKSIITSSTNHIIGHRIIKQIQWVSEEESSNDGQISRNLRLKFYHKVHSCGGNAVINYKERRFGSNRIAMSGDVVLVEQ